jgi:hypothetical protein
MRLLLASAVFALLFLSPVACALEPFEAYNSSKNYCGPESGPEVPRYPAGSDFSPACYEHDKCYHECSRTCRTQWGCDIEFYNNMMKQCNIHMLECMKKADEGTIGL